PLERRLWTAWKVCWRKSPPSRLPRAKSMVGTACPLNRASIADGATTASGSDCPTAFPPPRNGRSSRRPRPRRGGASRLWTAWAPEGRRAAAVLAACAGLRQRLTEAEPISPQDLADAIRLGAAWRHLDAESVASPLLFQAPESER